MVEVVNRIDQKRNRRQSHASIFKTTGREQILVTNALPTIMRKDSAVGLNAYNPLSNKTLDDCLSQLTGQQASLQYRKPPEEIDYTLKQNRYNFKYVPKGDVESAL